MKQAKDITEDELAEVIFRGEMVPRLAAFLDEQGWELQAWPSGADSAQDPKYHSFIVTPREVPVSAIEGLTPEQVAGYAEAWRAAGTGLDL